MIKHIVLFRFLPSSVNEAGMREIKKQLEELPAIIPQLKEIKVGININPSEKWHLSLEATVENRHDLDTYASHPAHQSIVKSLIAPIKEDRACVDYQF